MEITEEQHLINAGRSILEHYIPKIENVEGYLGWRIVETADFIQRRDHEVEIRALFLLVKINGDTDYHTVSFQIEEIEKMAYREFAELVLTKDLEGKVNIFILMDFEEKE